jgi:hypothetical protein
LEDDESSSKEETLVPLIQSTVANRVRSSTAKSVVERKCPANETWNSCGRVCETECSVSSEKSTSNNRSLFRKSLIAKSVTNVDPPNVLANKVLHVSTELVFTGMIV